MTVTFRQAVTQALGDALAADRDVFVLGEDIARAGGPFKATDGLFERFGAERVLDTPISEQAIVGTAIGAAARGLRPVAELMFADFAGVCFDQIANELAKYRYMTGGQVAVPVTIRMVNGAAGGYAAQHSQSVESWFLNVPGLKIAVPATVTDAYALLRAAIEDPDPVLVFEHQGLYGLRGELDVRERRRLGEAAVVRAGRDVTLVATQRMLHHGLAAAERLDAEGISVEVIDPRTLVPLDAETIGASVERTNRLVVAQETSNFGSWGASLAAIVLADRFDSLDAPPLLIGAPETPVPYAKSLEDAWLPSVDRIADGVRRMATSMV